MASITSLGLSGLPLNDLLRDLRQVEEAPLALLDQRKASFETRISAYGKIRNELEIFDAAVKNLANPNTFSALKTNSSNSNVLAATIAQGNQAVPGSYQVQVSQLASTQSLATAGQTSRDTALSTNATTLTFTLGDGSTHTLELTADQTSLEGLRSAINSADLGFSATLVNNGDDTTPHQLVFSTTTTGTAARAVDISADNPEIAAVLGYTEGEASAMTQMAEAKDANLTVNGIAIVSGSNTLKDAVEGLELELRGTTDAGASLTLTVAEDTEARRRAIETFVSSYNTVQKTVRDLTRYNAEDNQASVLTGDTVARAVQSRLSAALNTVVGDNEFTMLWDIGLSVRASDGSLQIDRDTLNDALRRNPEGVAALFTRDSGVVDRLETALQGLTGSRGLLTNATEGAQASIRGIQQQYENTQGRIEQKMAAYQSQFIALERYLSEMNGISSYLNSQLSMLESLSQPRGGRNSG